MGAHLKEHNKNPLDTLKIQRKHIIALHEAYIHTNKQYSKKRAERLSELLSILKEADDQRNTLHWDDEKKANMIINEKSKQKMPKEITQLQENLDSLKSTFNF